MHVFFLTYITDFRDALVNDLNNLLKLGPIEISDCLAQVLLLLKGENVVLCDRFLRGLTLVAIGCRSRLWCACSRLGTGRDRSLLFLLLFLLLLLRLGFESHKITAHRLDLSLHGGDPTCIYQVHQRTVTL